MYSPISRFSILLLFYLSIFMPITIFIVALQKSCCYQHTHPIVWVLSAVYVLISTVYLACHKFWMLHFPFHSVQNTFEYSFRFLLWSMSNLEVCNWVSKLWGLSRYLFVIGWKFNSYMVREHMLYVLNPLNLLGLVLWSRIWSNLINASQ